MQPGLKSFDRVAHCYDATRALPRDAEATVIAAIFAALQHVAAVPRVLEAGIGTGRIAIPLARAGARVVGIDIAPAMLARLRAKGADARAVIADAGRLPFRRASFDGALFVHLLHLVPDPGAALRAATAAVRAEGILLYVRTHYSESPGRLLMTRAREMAQELAGADLGWTDVHTRADRAFAEHGAAVGARMEEKLVARWPQRTSGRAALEALAGRVYSNTWVIPDAVMPELLRQLTPWFEALLGGLDRPIENEAKITLVTARLPGG